MPQRYCVAASLIVLAALSLSLFAAAADARDRLVRKDRMTVSLNGSLTADYGQDPDPGGEGGSLSQFGTYSGTWSWTQKRTSVYRRKRGTGRVYRSGTTTATTATLKESSSIRTRFYDGSVSDGNGAGCRGGSASQTVRSTEGGGAVRVPRRGERLSVAAGKTPRRLCNSGLDTDASGVLEDICVWGCLLPAGQLSADGTQERISRGGAKFRATYTVSVSFDLGKAPGKKVENRLPDDF